jgi:hypothetical protein
MKFLRKYSLNHEAMMKLNRNIWFLATLLVVGLVACKEDDTEISTITSFEKFSLTNLPAPIVVAEADAAHGITFNFDDKQIMDVHVAIETASSSTATEGEDFDLSTHEIAVAALGKSGSFEISVHSDFEGEGDETVVLHFSGTDPHGLPTPVESHVLTIRDSIYPVAVQLDWEGTFQYAGGTYTLCGNADIDLFLVDDQGNFAGGFGGATANCPERMFTGTLTDGDYGIVANLYDNGLFGAPGIDTIPIPMVVTVFKGGVVTPDASTLTYSTADFASVPLWTAYTPSDPNGEALAVVGTLRIGGGQATLINPDGAVVGSLNR